MHDWDQRYASTERLFPADPDEALVELAGELPAGRAVDLGAGEGRNSLWLARRGWQVAAVDLSPVALGRLAAQAADEKLPIETHLIDIAEFLGRAERFDLVVVAYMHPEPTQRTQLLAGAASAVAAGGHLFLVGHHLDGLGRAGPPDPDRLYTSERVQDALPGLEMLALERRERTVGDSSEPLIDLVAWAVRHQGA